MQTVTTFSGIKQTGDYMYNNVAVTISEITDNGRLRGSFVMDGKTITFSNSTSGLKARIDNGGKNPAGASNGSTNSSTFEKQFVKLQNAFQAAKIAFENFQAENDIRTIDQAKEKDAQAAAQKQSSSKRAKKQAARRSDDKLLLRIKALRKWAKDTKRMMLLQQLTDKMLEL